MVDCTGFLRHLQVHNNFDPTQFVRWSIAGQSVGWIHHQHLPWLRNQQTWLLEAVDGAWQLDPSLNTEAQRSDALHQLAQQVFEAKKIAYWHPEQVPVVVEWGKPLLATMPRSAVEFFGIQAFGVHLNAYSLEGGSIKLWMAKRAAHLDRFPNKLDHLVAGGVAAGDSLLATLLKEGEEEAGFPHQLSQSAKPVGLIHYHLMWNQLSRQDIAFVYDLQLPVDFVPQNQDGHVASFFQSSLAEAMELVANTDQIKSNVNLVLIDFFLRHGMIPADNPGFAALHKGLKGLI
jgi:8-oxo-dGTP pyrophosphatase MutT (NUDIX family)